MLKKKKGETCCNTSIHCKRSWGFKLMICLLLRLWSVRAPNISSEEKGCHLLYNYFYMCKLFKSYFVFISEDTTATTVLYTDYWKQIYHQYSCLTVHARVNVHSWLCLIGTEVLMFCLSHQNTKKVEGMETLVLFWILCQKMKLFPHSTTEGFVWLCEHSLPSFMSSTAFLKRTVLQYLHVSKTCCYPGLSWCLKIDHSPFNLKCGLFL